MKSNQPQPSGPDGDHCAVRHLELPERVLDMLLHRLRTDSKAFGNFHIAQGQGDVANDLAFSFGESLVGQN